MNRWMQNGLVASALAGTGGVHLSAMDVGGGARHRLDSMRRLDGRVRVTQVIDTDPFALAAARDAGHACHRGTLHDFRPLHRFDLVVLFDSVEWAADPAGVLQRVRADMLRPGGAVLAKTTRTDATIAALARRCGLWIIREARVPLSTTPTFLMLGHA